MNKLNNGFEAKIQIRDESHHVLYEGELDSFEKVKEFIEVHGKSKEGYSLIRGLVIPLRTSSLKDFGKDLFLPTFFNFSLTIHNLALKIFASICAIVLDIITLPLRVVITPFRICYNCMYPEKKDHPIIDLIKDQSDAAQAFEEKVVEIFYEIKQVKIEDSKEEDSEGNLEQTALESVIRGSIKVALQKLPGGINKDQFSEQEEKSVYSRGNTDDDWIRMTYNKESSSYFHITG